MVLRSGEYFKTKKSKFFLDVSRFNLISNSSSVQIIALGGINLSNFSKLQTKVYFIRKL